MKRKYSKVKYLLIQIQIWIRWKIIWAKPEFKLLSDAVYSLYVTPERNLWKKLITVITGAR
jgi:hypothetical protein